MNGMVNFTSALYLGLRHSHRSLRPWSQFTAGVPAAFAEPHKTTDVAREIASLQGCQQGVLSASSVHLFWDLLGMLGKRPTHIFFDSGLYPIARWGVERAGGLGAAMSEFAHQSPDALRLLLNSELRAQLRPLFVTDGFCPDCGKAAPLADYLHLAKEYRGLLIVDDTQSLGIFGQSAGPDVPYGSGGGGMLRWSRACGPEVIAISSLAKGFGVPLAVLAGANATVSSFKSRSETRVHCSPPAIAAIHAAEHALAVNRRYGDRLRLRVAALVSRFRDGVSAAGLAVTGGIFPVQNIDPGSRAETIRIYNELARSGIRTVLRKASGNRLRISFLFNARQTSDQIDRAVAALSAIGTPTSAR